MWYGRLVLATYFNIIWTLYKQVYYFLCVNLVIEAGDYIIKDNGQMPLKCLIICTCMYTLVGLRDHIVSHTGIVFIS